MAANVVRGLCGDGSQIPRLVWQGLPVKDVAPLAVETDKGPVPHLLGIYVQQEDLELRLGDEVQKVPAGFLWKPLAASREAGVVEVELVRGIYDLLITCGARTKEGAALRSAVEPSERAYRTLAKELDPRGHSFDPNLAFLMRTVRGEERHHPLTYLGGAPEKPPEKSHGRWHAARRDAVGRLRVRVQSVLDAFQVMTAHPFLRNAAFVRRDLLSVIALTGEGFTDKSLDDVQSALNRVKNAAQIVLIVPRVVQLVGYLGRWEMLSAQERTSACRLGQTLVRLMRSIDDTGFVVPVKSPVLASLERVAQPLEAWVEGGETGEIETARETAREALVFL